MSSELASRVYANRHKHLQTPPPAQQAPPPSSPPREAESVPLLFTNSALKQAYQQKFGGAQMHTHSPDEVTPVGVFDRRIIPLVPPPNAYLRPNQFSVFARCAREFVFSFFLQFAGAIAVTDPNNTPATIVTALAVSFSLPQFIAQVASYGTVGNSWFLLMNLALLQHEIETSDMVYCALATTAQMVGALMAMASAKSLRGNIDAYVPAPAADMTHTGVLGMEFAFCFLYGYLYLKLVRSSPRNEPPVVDSAYAPLTMAAFTYVGFMVLTPFTGSGVNLIRNLAPSIVSGKWPYAMAYSVLGQFLGYALATIAFVALYAHPYSGNSNNGSQS